MNQQNNLNEIAELKKIIAEQEQLLTEKNKNIAYLENLIAQIPCNIYWKNKDGYYLGCSNKNLNIGGWKSLENFVGKTIYELLDKKHAEELDQVDQQIMVSGKERVLEENWIDMNGNPTTYLTHKIPLYDEKHNVIGLLGASQDITSQKKMALELKKTKELVEEHSKTTNIYLNNLIASLPENFYWMDKESRVLGCNENQAKIFGLSSAELLGKNIYDITKILKLDNSAADTVRAHDLEIMETKQTKKVEESIFLDGVKKTFLSYKSAMVDDTDEVIGIFGVSVDITERKRMEEELLIAKEKADLANIAKSQFITNMSHDIKTPFSGILGFANLLHRRETDNTKKEMLNYIIQSSERLLGFLKEILELSKINQHDSIFSAKFNIHKSINDIIEMLLSEIKYKKLNLEVQIDKKIPIFLLGDKLKIERIILNLLSNSIKFTKKGSISIKTTYTSQTKDEIVLQIVIEDTGIGIPKDKYDSIFERFTRLNSSHEGNFEGVGLGLYMVKEYLKSLGGNISVESKVNVGTRFTCIIPFLLSKEDETLEETIDELNVTSYSSNRLSANSSTRAPKLILLIEDDLISQKISKLMLQEYFDCTIDIADDGQQALELVNKKQYDLILMDIGLPIIDGFTLTKKIRTLNNIYNTIPIIGLTAHVDESSQQIAEINGLNIILSKPLSEEVFNRIILFAE